MKKFYPHPLIRYFSGIGILALMVILPLTAGFLGAGASVPGEEWIFLVSGLLVSLGGCVVVHLWFWEKCFSHLELSDSEIRWKCPLRRDRVMSVDQCAEIGAYMENEGNGIPKAQIYFSDHLHPKQNMGKNGVMKASEHLIKFWYSEELCKYLIGTYSGKQTSCLSAYRRRRKR